MAKRSLVILFAMVIHAALTLLASTTSATNIYSNDDYTDVRKVALARRRLANIIASRIFKTHTTDNPNISIVFVRHIQPQVRMSLTFR
jgi:hypothetical protein